jgi:PPOX class probable F420-dependent enzyme
MDSDWARARFEVARVARLATADDFGRSHLVPIVFAVDGSVIHSAVDAKPKSSTALRRLANIAANPQVSLLVDYYDDDDWTQLWWARADGQARVHDDGSAAIGPLAQRYAQYREAPPDGPFIAIAVERWSGWSAAPG